MAWHVGEAQAADDDDASGDSDDEEEPLGNLALTTSLRVKTKRPLEDADAGDERPAKRGRGGTPRGGGRTPRGRGGRTPRGGGKTPRGGARGGRGGRRGRGRGRGAAGQAADTGARALVFARAVAHSCAPARW